MLHRRDYDSAFRWSVFGSILQKIDEELFQQNTIRVNEWKVVWNLCCHDSLTHKFFGVRQGSDNDLFEWLPIPPNVEALIQPRHFEQVGHDLIQALGFVRNALGKFLPLGLGEAVFLLQQSRRSTVNRRQGRFN